MQQSRRLFLTGAVALIAAPAVVRFANLMPIRGILVNVKSHAFGVRALIGYSTWAAQYGIVTDNGICELTEAEYRRATATGKIILPPEVSP